MTAYHLQGLVKAYDPASDSCTVELTGLGFLDAWFTGVKVEAPINRAFLVKNNPCTVSVSDPNRLCEARIISVTDSPSSITSSSGSGTGRTISGQVQINTDLQGTGSAPVTFASPFTSPPQVSIYAAAQGGAVSLSSVSTTGFTVTLTGSTLHQGALLLAWSAAGQ